MKKKIITIILVFSILVCLCSCGKSYVGKYEFSDTTYDFLIDTLLEEEGVKKGSKEYKTAKALIEGIYSFDTLKESYGTFAFEFDRKGNLSLVAGDFSLPFASYKVDRKDRIYDEDDGTYYGYFKKKVYWCSLDGEEYEIPFTKTK